MTFASEHNAMDFIKERLSESKAVILIWTIIISTFMTWFLWISTHSFGRKCLDNNAVVKIIGFELLEQEVKGLAMYRHVPYVNIAWPSNVQCVEYGGCQTWNIIFIDMFLSVYNYVKIRIIVLLLLWRSVSNLPSMESAMMPLDVTKSHTPDIKGHTQRWSCVQRWGTGVTGQKKQHFFCY